MLFDESLNKAIHTKQMDFHVRFWQANGEVKTRYLGSEFIGHATAADMLKFNACVGKLNLAKLVQIAMDGPTVNWAFYERMETDLKLNMKLTLLDIGSCNLHVVHGAFRDGSRASGWELDHFLNSLYWLFKDTPARREDFTKVTGCTSFPFKVCSHRWIENVPVCERALSLLSHVRSYVSAVAAGTVVAPQSKSFEVVKDAFSESLLRAKLLFCISVATQLTPFRTTFQTDQLMAPFLCRELYKMLKSLMDRFIKQSVMSDINTAAKLVKVDLTKEANYRDYSKIDVGFSTENELKKLYSSKKLNDRQVMEFRMQCKSWLKATVQKLCHKTAVQY